MSHQHGDTHFTQHKSCRAAEHELMKAGMSVGAHDHKRCAKRFKALISVYQLSLPIAANLRMEPHSVLRIIASVSTESGVNTGNAESKNNVEDQFRVSRTVADCACIQRDVRLWRRRK
jgi:hypothetical protein